MLALHENAIILASVTSAVIARLLLQAAVAAASLGANGVAPEAAAGAAQHLVTAIDNVFGCAAAISAAFGNRVRPAVLSSTAALPCSTAWLLRLAAALAGVASSFSKSLCHQWSVIKRGLKLFKFTASSVVCHKTCAIAEPLAKSRSMSAREFYCWFALLH